MKAVGVIPSRYASTRFPGKPLAPIAGKSLLSRVVARVKQAGTLSEVLVATDDERIFAEAQRAGATGVMTRSDHPSGTDRVAEAAAGRGADIVVNIQGDEPLISPALIDRLVRALAEDATLQMATAASPIADADDLHRSDVVKVVRRADGTALYFSRAPIPFRRGAGEGFAPVAGLHLRHIGIYAYRRDFLDKLVATPPCALEETEKLEQLRALALGARMAVIETEESGLGVDTPEDVARVEAALRALGEE
jgi:3-deoxy-manno-octulosonate cytidylyltransferase (CMP-KDO synthetase)